MSGNDVLIRVSGLEKHFAGGAIRALDGVSAEIRRGEVVVVIGPSGSGKSTCARLAARLWDVTKGAVKVGGVDISTVDPEVLLLDEPCSALDVKSSAVIEEMLTELKKQYTIVIVTHNIAQARRISDYGAFLLGGRLVEWGESDQLFGCPAQEETRAFLAGIYG